MPTYHKASHGIAITLLKKWAVGIRAFSHMSRSVDQLVGNFVNNRDNHLVGVVDTTNLHKDLVPSSPQAAPQRLSSLFYPANSSYTKGKSPLEYVQDLMSQSLCPVNGPLTSHQLVHVPLLHDAADTSPFVFHLQSTECCAEIGPCETTQAKASGEKDNGCCILPCAHFPDGYSWHGEVESGKLWSGALQRMQCVLYCSSHLSWVNTWENTWTRIAEVCIRV